MHISSLNVSNYKSFRRSDVIELSKGFNIIVGKNNSGKTALAEASTLEIEDKPHRREIARLLSIRKHLFMLLYIQLSEATVPPRLHFTSWEAFTLSYGSIWQIALHLPILN